MPNRPPHFIITGAVAALCHYAQAGVEMLRMVFSDVRLESLAAVMLHITMAIVGVRLLLVACRTILAGARLIANLEDRCVAWGRQKVVELANWIIAYLTQESPHP